MINARNRQFSSDSKTGEYPTLQSIYCIYLQSEENAGIPNDNFINNDSNNMKNELKTFLKKQLNGSSDVSIESAF